MTEDQHQEEARLNTQKEVEKKEQELNTKLLRVDVDQALVDEGLEKNF